MTAGVGLQLDVDYQGQRHVAHRLDGAEPRLEAAEQPALAKQVGAGHFGKGTNDSQNVGLGARAGLRIGRRCQLDGKAAIELVTPLLGSAGNQQQADERDHRQIDEDGDESWHEAAIGVQGCSDVPLHSASSLATTPARPAAGFSGTGGKPGSAVNRPSSKRRRGWAKRSASR